MSVHHIRKLADLAATDSQPAWAAHMADKRRKSLVVCATCHEAIHTETPTAPHAQ
jgi:cytochrome c553